MELLGIQLDFAGGGVIRAFNLGVIRAFNPAGSSAHAILESFAHSLPEVPTTAEGLGVGVWVWGWLTSL